MTTWTESMDGSSYVVELQPDGFREVGQDEVYAASYGSLVFQHGPIKEVGVNGTTIEVVIDALVNRLEGFQRGEFKSRENALAITHLQEAQNWLYKRTRDRQKRGVEGTNVA